MLRALLLSAVVAGVTAGAALAQNSIYDPQQLPVFHGTVASYSLTPRDDLDGVILEDGTEIHISARLSSELAFAVKPGDKVTVHGLKATVASLVQAVSIANDATGMTLVDAFRPDAPPYGYQAPPRMMEAKGRVKLQLHAPDGKLDGVMLEDGTIIRFPMGYTPTPLDCLTPGRDVVAAGNGLVSLLGRVLEARSIRLAAENSAPGAPGVWRPTEHLPLLNPPSVKVSKGAATGH